MDGCSFLLASARETDPPPAEAGLRHLLCGGRSRVVKAPGCGPGDRGFESLRPPHRFDITLLALLLLPLLLLAACNGGGGDGGATATDTPASGTPPATSVATPVPGAVQLPEGFPTDFPIYEKVTITAASRVSAAQGNIYAMGMETTDAADAVRSFYEARLAEAPWDVSNVVEIPEQSTVIVEFSRREGGGQAGTLAIQEEQTNGRRTLITVSLPAPAGAGTPTPAASPGP